MMRAKSILGNFVKNPNVLYTHTPIKKLAWEHEAYTTLITFLPECRELRVDCAGKEILLAGPGYKWLIYLPMGERWCITAFYSPANELLEWYFDISRSNFIDQHGMPCIDDIFLDLVILPDGQAVTVDADELQEAYDKAEITQDDFNNAYVVHDQIKNSKWGNVDFLCEISRKLLLEHELGDIPDFETFVKVEPINEGLSMPTCYMKDCYIQWTDGIPYKLKEPFDFSFLDRYGKVFRVFDGQDSGNICFGVMDGEKQCFVKFAGAPTERSNVTPNDAIKRMKSTIQIYNDLSHPILANLLYAEEIGGGIACVFEWHDAECMGTQYPQSREKFLQLSTEAKL